jgi:hypothetical protein
MVSGVGLSDAASADASGAAAGESKAAWRSSANEMRAPGSFPYRTSFTLDRESGGDVDSEKGVFCWALEDGKVVGEGVRITEKEIGGLDERAEAEAVGDGSGKCSCGWES